MGDRSSAKWTNVKGLTVYHPKNQRCGELNKPEKQGRVFCKSATGIEPSLKPPEIGLILEISFMSYPKQARTTLSGDLCIMLSHVWRGNECEKDTHICLPDICLLQEAITDWASENLVLTMSKKVRGHWSLKSGLTPSLYSSLPGHRGGPRAYPHHMS